MTEFFNPPEVRLMTFIAESGILTCPPKHGYAQLLMPLAAIYLKITLKGCFIRSDFASYAALSSLAIQNRECFRSELASFRVLNVIFLPIPINYNFGEY